MAKSRPAPSWAGASRCPFSSLVLLITLPSFALGREFSLVWAAMTPDKVGYFLFVILVLLSFVFVTSTSLLLVLLSMFVRSFVCLFVLLSSAFRSFWPCARGTPRDRPSHDKLIIVRSLGPSSRLSFLAFILSSSFSIPPCPFVLQRPAPNEPTRYDRPPGPERCRPTCVASAS